MTRHSSGDRPRAEVRLGAVAQQIAAGALGLLTLVLAGVALDLVGSPGISRADGRTPAVADAPLDAELRSVDDVVPVASYSLEAKLDVERHTVTGRGTIRFQNTSEEPLSHVFLHLYMNAFEHEKTVFRRRSGAGMRGDDDVTDPGSISVQRFAWAEEGSANLFPETAHTPGDPDDRTDIRVALPRALRPGETATFEMEFETELPSIALRAGHAGRFHMVAQWFPKLAKLERDGTFAHFPYERFSEFYSDFGDYDVTLDVPASFEVGATGKRTKDEKVGDRRRLRFEQRAVGDFAFAAWDGFAEASRIAGPVTLRCLYPRGEERAARIELDAAARGLEVFGRWLGPYPYEDLTIVHPPPFAAEAGGMEYPTLFTTGGAHWTPLAPARVLEVLTLHELAHQWFYGVVATNENASPFLDEGLTSYATARAMVEIYGQGGLVPASPFPISLAELERASQLGIFDRIPIASRSGDFQTGGDYARVVYQRTSTLMHTLDGAFDDAAHASVAAFARRWRFGHPGPADLVASFRETAGEDAANLLDDALHRSAGVDFVIVGIENHPEGGGFEREVTVERRGKLVLPVVVEMIDERGVRTTQRSDGRDASTTIRTHGDARIRSALVDPEHDVLLDENRRNDALSLEPRWAAPRTFIVSSLAAALIVHAVSP